MRDHDHGIYAPRPLTTAGEHTVGLVARNCHRTAQTTRENNTRFLLLCASVVQCSARTPGTVCVSVPVPGFSRVCPIGHTVLPAASTFFAVSGTGVCPFSWTGVCPFRAAPLEG